MAVSPGEIDRIYKRGSRENSIAHLELRAEEFRKDPFNPEAVTLFQQAFWQVPRGEEGFTFDIPLCDATEEQLLKPFVDINDGTKLSPHTLYVPDELRGKEGLIMLDKMFPELTSHNVSEETEIEDEFDQTGYIQVERVLDSPNLNTTEDQLREYFDSQGVRGQRLITYIIASKQMEVLKGQGFDRFSQTSRRSRLLGSRRENKAVDARFLPLGHLVVGRYLDRHASSYRLGGRSERAL